ncbi:MAG: hypothetical protein COA66_04145 [Arcobacter sp.]|nr:MAG: hypothetical protein COA66_04145 [Arcobacter sp.]
MNYYNSDLADIGFKLILPCKELEPYIYNYWIIRKEKLHKTISNKILSDGNSGIVINFASSSFLTKINQKNFISKNHFTYCGPTKYPLFMEFENQIDAIGIRFKAGGAYRFFNEDISSFKDIVVEMQNSTVLKIDALYEKLINTSEIENKISIIESFLIKKIQSSSKNNSLWIFDFINNILKNKGYVNIEALCKDFNISPRLCARRFKQEVGLSAKLFARLARIVNTKETLSSLKVDSLTSVAYDNGFFDQAHFSNEFKAFMSETPKDYFSKKYKMAKGLNFKEFRK